MNNHVVLLELKLNAMLIVKHDWEGAKALGTPRVNRQ